MKITILLIAGLFIGCATQQKQIDTANFATLDDVNYGLNRLADAVKDEANRELRRIEAKVDAHYDACPCK